MHGLGGAVFDGAFGPEKNPMLRSQPWIVRSLDSAACELVILVVVRDIHMAQVRRERPELFDPTPAWIRVRSVDSAALDESAKTNLMDAI